jgi:predicted ester cyclase
MFRADIAQATEFGKAATPVRETNLDAGNIKVHEDYVATRYTITGTHDGDLMGTPPTGKNVAFTGITISRCENGRIAEEWEITDAVGLLGQVGALPAMAQS